MTTPPTIQTKPLDPVFSGVPVVFPQEGLVNPTWNKWFVDLREKVNVINATLAAWSGITPVTGLTPGTYGDTTHYPIVTVNEFGLITAITVESGGGGGLPMHVTTVTSNYTVALTDVPNASSNIGMITGNSTSPISVGIDVYANTNIPVGAHIFASQLNTGAVSFLGLTGITFIGPTISGGGRGSMGEAIQIATDTWLISGNLAYSLYNPPVYATLNPSDTAAGITLSGGDLIATKGSSGWAATRANQGKSSGKYYFEITNNANGASNGSLILGFAASTSPLTYPGADSSGYGFQVNDINAGTVGLYHSGTYSASSYVNGVAGDVSCVAIDLSAGKIWFRIAGRASWLGGGDPASGTSPSFTFTSGITLLPMIGEDSSPQQATANFGASAFAATPPTGFLSGWYT